MQFIIIFKEFKFTFFLSRWDEEMDNDLIKEMLNSNIFSYKYNSKSRGAQWKLLAEKLNECWGDSFQTNERALRDKYNGLKKGFKNKIRYEEAASGITPPDLTELERGLEELIEKEEQDKNEDKFKSEKEEALSAQDRCMKGMTPKRKGSEEEVCSNRVSRNDTITYLREKMERKDKWRREEADRKDKQFMAELEVRKLESEERRMQAEAQNTMFKELFNMLARK
ncbi:stress response protein NST1-like [Anneissia japonica]|uniref:stress response protein NST1-like n=1 Tax=Anneissia japonica TaxID=1529436 RepID=UPI001425A777|nr:stress response protein NST1-like [Anneissia japonica]